MFASEYPKYARTVSPAPVTSRISLALVGMIAWLVVGILWHDRALIVLNAVSVAIYGVGIMNSWFGS